MTTAISIENISKMYRLGQVGTGTISHDLNRLWAKLRGKEDPYRRIGEDNKRDEPGGDYVWALRDINLEVEQGQILGIIGCNGAGKSTLLKLLSRVTAPTTGSIRAKGRIGSLLEVGTGFHPELTGRENIFLNGAILGMTKVEIQKCFDQIVDFSGCVKYINTPVKRYSSGMYVRLAFAVAAHLKSDILIVDEVLAVGDADFQNRCIGKMKDVSHELGRTILFVSHNMSVIKKLCPHSVWLQHGQICEQGDTADVVSTYLAAASEVQRRRIWGKEDVAETDEIRLHEISICDTQGACESVIATNTPLEVKVRYAVKQPIHNLRVALLLMTRDGTEVISSSDMMSDVENTPRKPGEYVSICHIPPLLLNRMSYVVSVDFDVPCERNVLSGNRVEFEVAELSVNQLGRTNAPAPAGILHPLLDWEVKAA